MHPPRSHTVTPKNYFLQTSQTSNGRLEIALKCASISSQGEYLRGRHEPVSKTSEEKVQHVNIGKISQNLRKQYFLQTSQTSNGRLEIALKCASISSQGEYLRGRHEPVSKTSEEKVQHVRARHPKRSPTYTRVKRASEEIRQRLFDIDSNVAKDRNGRKTAGKKSAELGSRDTTAKTKRKIMYELYVSLRRCSRVKERKLKKLDSLTIRGSMEIKHRREYNEAKFMEHLEWNAKQKARSMQITVSLHFRSLIFNFYPAQIRIPIPTKEIVFCDIFDMQNSYFFIEDMLVQDDVAIAAMIIRIAETKQNFLDLSDLEDHLKLHQHSGRQLIGCFSAASNVTGILVDDVASTMLLHKYGALAFWDYNLVAPYISINMNYKVTGVEENINVYKDAIYFSGHKFIGGVQTPGILVAKKFLFRRTEISDSESFFAPQEQNRTFEVQEEGSAAPVIESVRAGLIMQLKETITVANILMRQEKINKQVLQHIRTIPEIILLGNTSTGLKRIPVFSFMVRHPRGTFLHHNFVCAVLNDIFGIQARGGCPCSGAYAQDLLGIDQNLASSASKHEADVPAQELTPRTYWASTKTLRTNTRILS
ncbi:Aminotransferase class-V [Popillia japonica]|uniref:Aminotransferase class-V n=1 Tax=Popillia japonica TaxID=7064 RepID=A0AAW1KJR7_POPJA